MMLPLKSELPHQHITFQLHAVKGGGGSSDSSVQRVTVSAQD